MERLVAALFGRFAAGDGRGAGRVQYGPYASGAMPRGRGQRDGADPREVLGDVESRLYDQPFRLPVQLAFFGRMVGMLLGLTATLSPSFDFNAVATPYARQFMGSGGLEGILRLLGIESVEALGRDLLRDGLATLRSLASVPRRLDRLLERVEQGELRFHLGGNQQREREAPPAPRRSGSRRRVRHALSRPVPVWVPAAAVGAVALAFLARRGPRARAHDGQRET